MKTVLDVLTNYGPTMGNIVALLVLLYMLADLARNWNGSPELRIIERQLQEINFTLRQLISRISS